VITALGIIDLAWEVGFVVIVLFHVHIDVHGVYGFNVSRHQSAKIRPGLKKVVILPRLDDLSAAKDLSNEILIQL
jgi:hypothetical protein